MNSRSKKYFTGVKKSDTKATNKKPEDLKTGKQDNPATQKTSPNQDDTGGGNDSGKRSDDN